MDIEKILRNSRMVELNSKENYEKVDSILNGQYAYEALARVLNIEEDIIKVWGSWYNINDEWYYYKRPQYKENNSGKIIYFFNELIGEQIAKYLKIDTVHYEIAHNKVSQNKKEVNQDYGLISKNFRTNDKKYIFCTDLCGKKKIKNMRNLHSLKVRNKFKNKENYKEFKNKILAMTIMDFYRNELDRRSCNFVISKDQDGMIDLCPLFDYELSFDKVANKYTNAFLAMDFSKFKERMYIRKSKVMQETLKKLMNMNIKDLVNKIETYYKLKVPKEIVNTYLYNDTVMKSKIKEYKLIK